MGAATLLEYDESVAPIVFDYESDGSDSDKLLVEAGGFRVIHDDAISKRQCDDSRNYRAKSELFMSGPDVFLFTIKEVPKIIMKTLDEANWSTDDLTAYFFTEKNSICSNI